MKQIARILEITSYPPPRAGWGVRVEHVKRSLERDGHHCVVLNIGANRRAPSREYVTVLGLVDYMWKVLRFSMAGYTVHMHMNGDSPKGFALALIAEVINACCGRRCVVTFHAGPEQRLFPQHRAYWLTPLYMILFAIPARIICNSAAVKAAIVGYGVNAAKVVPIPAFSRQYLEFDEVPLPPPVEAFCSARTPLLTSYVFFRPEFFIESLIDAMGLLVRDYPSAGLAIMGSDAGSEAIREQVRRLGLDDHVIFCGDLPHDAFMTLLRRGDIYIRTPKKDGVCSSVLEALSLQVPVVASENQARPEGVVTFTAGDAGDLARAVRHVMTHRADVERALVVPHVEDTVQVEADLLSRGAYPVASHA